MVKEFRNEFEVPPNSKIRICCTICEKLINEVKVIHQKELALAKNEDRSEPDWSNTIEMLLRKGVRIYKQTPTGK